MPAVIVIKPGLLTTIQDRGRWGLQARGVPVAGPMDPCSHRVANALVGNPPDAATLEITLIGPELEFEDERVLAVAGAEFSVSVDDRKQPPNAPFVVKRGGRLGFGGRARGARAYLAISGGVAVPPVMGSRATHLVSRLGGLGGRALRAGDRLPLGDIHLPSSARLLRALSPEIQTGLLAPPDARARIRVLPGPQREHFSSDALDALQSASYVVSTSSDRMGFRLEGPILERVRGREMISDATPLGALQVPASGQPVLLMADRQTTGGYPKIATVITADIGIAGQLAPGDRISFEVSTLQQAYAALIAQEQALMAIEAIGRQ